MVTTHNFDLRQRLSLIFARRSIRSFTSQKIPDMTVEAILEAAMAAPSACNKRPYEFIRVDSPAQLKKLSDFLPNGKFLAEAPMAIVVCGDLANAHANEISYLLQDCSAAIQNILLAATALDLAACWLGVHPRPERIKGIACLFALPDNIVPVSVVAIGYPAGPYPSPRTQYDPSKIHINSW